MRVTGEDFETVLKFVDKKFPVGSCIWDHNHSAFYYFKEDSIFEVFSDNHETAESYKIMVRDNNDDSKLFTVIDFFKDWIFDYVKRRCNE